MRRAEAPARPSAGAGRERAVGVGVHLAAGRVRRARRRAVRVRVLRQRDDALPRGQAARRAGPRGARSASSAPPGACERLTHAILRETRMPAVQVQPCVTTDGRRPRRRARRGRGARSVLRRLIAAGRGDGSSTALPRRRARSASTSPSSAPETSARIARCCSVGRSLPVTRRDYATRRALLPDDRGPTGRDLEAMARPRGGRRAAGVRGAVPLGSLLQLGRRRRARLHGRLGAARGARRAGPSASGWARWCRP